MNAEIRDSTVITFHKTNLHNLIIRDSFTSANICVSMKDILLVSSRAGAMKNSGPMSGINFVVVSGFSGVFIVT